MKLQKSDNFLFEDNTPKKSLSIIFTNPDEFAIVKKYEVNDNQTSNNEEVKQDLGFFS
jgi:hypothetical protein